LYFVSTLLMVIINIWWRIFHQFTFLSLLLQLKYFTSRFQSCLALPESHYWRLGVDHLNWYGGRHKFWNLTWTSLLKSASLTEMYPQYDNCNVKLGNRCITLHCHLKGVRKERGRSWINWLWKKKDRQNEDKWKTKKGKKKQGRREETNIGRTKK
jgi:hypothetical protein